MNTKINFKNKIEGFLIYPHQLFKDETLFKSDGLIFLIEEPLMFTQYNFHKQKLVLHRASMKAYELSLKSKGYRVQYIESSQLKKTADIVKIIKTYNVTDVRFYDPVDDWLEKRLTDSLTIESINYEIIETPMFLTDRNTFKNYFDTQKGSRKYFMKNFYEWQRKRLNILIDDNNKPVGGSWSYDTENRKKIPKSISLPEIPKKAETQNVLEAKKYIEENFPNNYGDDSFFFYPTTHTEAENWLDDFLKNKLELFGPYEDAMVSENNILFHSLLSPILNIGLLTPKYVIDRTIKYTEEKETFHLASLEGFIRQVIGWREYIRAIYVIEGRKIRSGNYFKASKDLPKSFWTGNTGIYPVDQAIKNILKTAYSHHIERLMVMGNFMNLCGFKPDQIYRWFMEMYIDSYDWVMVPNVYSMALYADGGIITTKPYISGSNYILKMSNYKKEKWAEKWDTLFWNFVGKHYEDLKTEGRLGFIGILYQKMPEDKKENYREEAKKILEKLV